MRMAHLRGVSGVSRFPVYSHEVGGAADTPAGCVNMAATGGNRDFGMGDAVVEDAARPLERMRE